MVLVSRPLPVYHHSQRRPKSAQPPFQSCRRGRRSRLTDSTSAVLQYLAQALHFLGGGFHLDAAVKDPKRGTPNFANNLVNDTPAIIEFRGYPVSPNAIS
jgi:hypothetical protein